MSGLTPKTSGINKISTGYEQLVRDFNESYTVREYKVITFYAQKDCTLIWNETERLEIMAGAGLVLDERFKPIYSLVIVEPSIPYYFTIGK